MCPSPDPITWGRKAFPVDDTPEVDVHDPLDVLELGLLEITVGGDAGIVVDLVDLTEVGDDGVGVGQHRLPLGDIAFESVHFTATFTLSVRTSDDV